MARHNSWRDHLDGVRGMISDVYALMGEFELSTAAASLAYTTILSIIPVLAVSFSLLHAFGGLEKLLADVEPFILSNLAHGTGEDVTLALQGFISNAHANAVGIGGFVGLIITTMIMFSSAEKAINKIWGAKVQRRLFHRISAYWLFVTVGPMALAVVVGLATSSDMPLSHLLPSGAGISLVTVVLLFCVYHFVPNCPVDWRCSFIAASITAFLWSLAGFGYEIYAKKALSYNKIYGSLGAVPVLLVWIYIMWHITLFGATLTAVLQKRVGKTK